MIIRFNTLLQIDLTEWALPLEIWWTKDALCFEILCLAITFCRNSYLTPVIVDELGGQ